MSYKIGHIIIVDTQVNIHIGRTKQEQKQNNEDTLRFSDFQIFLLREHNITDQNYPQRTHLYNNRA